jgi:hypothetical protein
MYTVKGKTVHVVKLHVFLPSALGKSEFSASQTGYFTPEKLNPNTHYI